MFPQSIGRQSLLNQPAIMPRGVIDNEIYPAARQFLPNFSQEVGGIFLVEAINLHGDHRSPGTDDRGIKQDFLFAGGGRVNFRGNTLLKPAFARQSILFNLTFINIYREAAGSAACF